MAEPMVLAFEKRYEAYRWHRYFFTIKSESIYHMSKKHGFTPGPLIPTKDHPEEKIADVIKAHQAEKDGF